MNTSSKFAETLNYLIFEEKMDAKTFAGKIGVDPTCITRYTSEKRCPSVENLVIIADYFNCSTDYLLGLEEQKHTQTFKQIPPFDVQLKKLLNEFNYTCLGLANKTKINKSSVYAWKSGKRVPTLDNILKLAECFDCRVDFVLGRES